MSSVTIGKYEIGTGKPCFIITDAGVNHNGSFELAKKLVDVAVEAGVHCVKFQTFKAKGVVTESGGMATYQKKNMGQEESQVAMLKKYELDYDDFRRLKEYCDEKGIMFASTPHSADAVDFLDPLMLFYKIGSGDVTNIPLLKSVAKKGKPIMLSVGMANIAEIREAVECVYAEGNKQIVLLHCTTSYPCPLNAVNLRVMETMRKEFPEIPIGYSDHTEGIEVAKLAAAEGAVVVEKHHTTDKSLPGPDHVASLSPEELKNLVKDITSGDLSTSLDRELVLGSSEKVLLPIEVDCARIARKSVVSLVDIPEGTVITEEMLAIKRPEMGLRPKYYEQVVGKKAARNIAADSCLQKEDVEGLTI